MSPVSLAYRVAVRVARTAAPLLARGSGKLARGIAGRRESHELLARWGRRERDRARPAVWFHAPSVGEGLQAEAVMRALAERRPGIQVAFTYFSPSAEALGRRIASDVSAYLPWDIEAPISRALDGVAPDLLVFTKTEVWPVLVEEAVRRGIPVALVGGSVPPKASRLRWPVRSLLLSTWSRLSAACAISDEDAAGLVALGVPEDVVRTTGDPGIDSAARRAAEADPSASHLAPFLADTCPTVVAGSTWPADEDELLPALSDVRAAVPDLRVIVAPHEPSEGRVAGLRRRLGGLGWRAAALSDVERRGSVGEAEAIVVDRVGVLAHVYTVGDAAYVGGGFGRDGLHSVLEPAAAAVPVVFGPRHENARPAGELVAARGARVAADSAVLADVLTEWLTSPEARQDASERAIGYIEAHRGAAERTAALLDPLMRLGS